MRRVWATIGLSVAVFSATAFAEISPPPTMPTLHSVEWTVGPGLLGTSLDQRPALVLGLAVPVARVGTESELYVGVESGLSPVWDPFVAGIPVLGQAYVRTRLSEATALRLGVASGIFVALGSGVSRVAFVALATPAFDIHLTKRTRVVFEPALGISASSTGTYFAYYPRVLLGFSL